MQRTEGTRDIIQRYDELLVHRHLDSTVTGLAEATTRMPALRYDERPACRVLRPSFVDARTYARVRRAANRVAKGIFDVVARMVRDAELRASCAFDDGDHLRLVRVERRNRAPHLYGRLDGFLAPDGRYQIIEYSGTPGGVFIGEALADTFAKMPIMKELGRHHRLRSFPTSAYLAEAYREAHRRWRDASAPVVAVVDRDRLAAGRGGFAEKNALITTLRGRGLDLVIVRSEQLSFRGGRLFADGTPVDAVHYLSDDVLEDVGEDAIIRALERRAIWLVVGPGSLAMFGKSIFAVLSDPRYANMFDDDVRDALRRHVPFTRFVREQHTTYRGRTIDLLPFVARHREDFVLKPSDGTGGAGVFLGTACDETEWSDALRRALDTPYVVQERVELGKGDFPCLDGERLRFQSHYSGLDPYTWNGPYASGCLVRLSRSPLMNVAIDGSITPLFLVD